MAGATYRQTNRCPRCGRGLQPLGFEVGEALGCDSCGGVMLDHAAFCHVRDSAYRQIVERMGGGWIDVPIADPSAPLACPKCQNPMVRTSLDEIPLDYCGEDGTWFDHQELMAVATALSRARPGERPSVHGDGRPYARSPEVAERLAELQAELRSQVTRTATTAAIARLERLRFRGSF